MPPQHSTNRHVVLIDPQRLSESALTGLIEEFVNRDGTDYGATEASLPAKQHQIRRLLDSGEVVIAFDVEQETFTLVDAKAYADALCT